MISSHNSVLSGVFGEKLHKMNFHTYIPESASDHDSVVSRDDNLKVAFITRHHLDFTCSATHGIILEKEFFERL